MRIQFSIIAELSPGQYKHDRWNGKGTYHYAHGDEYTGEWVDDLKVGQGVFTWADGGRYRRNCSEKMKCSLLVVFRVL